MASARTGLTLRPISSLVSGVRQLYQRPPNTITGIDPTGSPYSPNQPVQPMAGPGQNLEPRAFNTWSGQNLIFTPRSDATYSAADLKALAMYPLARMCIENVKDSVCRAPWEITPRARPGESRKSIHERSKGDDNLLKLNRFFEYPDREHNWQEWLRPLLDDLLVIDAPAIWIRQTRDGSVAELAVIRGETICRYIDENGFTPMAPSPAYAQDWWGLPFTNLTTDQLIYKPRNIVPRQTLSSQLYGCAPTEQLAPEIQVGTKRLEFTLAYYTEGSIPGVVQVVPRGTNPDRIEEAMEWMNSKLAGNLAARNQWRLVQGFQDPGKEDQIIFSKQPLLADLYDENHTRKVAFGYGTSPQRLLKMIRTEGKGSSDAAQIEGTLPWDLWVKGVIDYFIQRKLGLSDYEFAINPYAEPDPLKNAAALTMYVSKGVLTPNETRKRVGEELRPEPEADQLGIITGTGFIPLGVAPVVAGVKTNDDGQVEPHDVKPTAPPKDPNKAKPVGDKNASRGSKPPQQEAGNGRSTGRNSGAPNGKESLDNSKKKILKRVGSRIEGHLLTPESVQSVHAIQHAVQTVFNAQARKARAVADRFHKTLGNALTKRKFGNVQFNLAPPDAARVLAIPVDDADFAAKNRDMQPHVTVLWGFHPEVTVEQINTITKGIGEVEITLGPLEAFPGNPDGVPLVIRFENERLAKLNAALRSLPHTQTFPDYKPHICIGYLKPHAAAQKYVNAGNPLQGEVFKLSNLVYSAVNYDVTELEKLMLPSARLDRMMLRRAEKYTHAEVQFEHPAKGASLCAFCKHYNGPNDCELVESPVAPEDWCNKFTVRGN